MEVKLTIVLTNTGIHYKFLVNVSELAVWTVQERESGSFRCAADHMRHDPDER
jgi:hypothetical protein